MKILRLLLIIVTIFLFYKWRFKILNQLLAIDVLRKLAVQITMEIPQLRDKLLPILFGSNGSSENN